MSLHVISWDNDDHDDRCYPKLVGKDDTDIKEETKMEKQSAEFAKRNILCGNNNNGNKKTPKEKKIEYHVCIVCEQFGLSKELWWR